MVSASRQEKETFIRKGRMMMNASVHNLLLEKVEYKIEKTDWGTWRRFMYPNGVLFEEFVSHARYFGMPLLHYTRGKCPETGKRIVAKGIIAVGRLAVGGLAIGHASAGVIAVGQLAFGLMFGLGQACTGMYAVGQLALAVMFGIGQFATGQVVIGQFALGKYVLAQLGIGEHVWDMRGASNEAREFFKTLLGFK
jgi:hypothetical protein